VIAKKAGLKKLFRMMKILEGQVVRCSRCGMCQAVCPLYATTGHEKDTARGKLMLLSGLLREMFTNPGGVSKRLNHCLLCGSCESACPRNIQILEVFLTARAIITEYEGLSFAKKILFRHMMTNPNLFNRLVQWGARRQYLFFKPTGDETAESCSRVVSPILSSRNTVALAPVPFHKMNINSKGPVGGPHVKVAFFVGCLLDKFFPEIAKTIVNVLRFHGASIFIPTPQGCCGIPFLSSGDKESFNRLVDYHMGIFNAGRFDYLVTGCATCTATIRKLWPKMKEMKSVDEREKVTCLSEKTYDISQFLVKIIGVQDKNITNKPYENGVKTTITIHDPCHLRKTLKIFEEPRILINKNPNYALKEMQDPGACCGMGGSFNIEHYKVSTDIGLRKADNIKSSGASVVATGCPACMIQLKDMLAKTHTSVHVKHFIEVYSENLI